MDTASLINLVLERCEAERMLSPLKTRLVKLLYLAEIEYFRRTGKRLTNLDWKFHHFGPYAFALADYLGNPDIDSLVGSISAHPKNADHDIQSCVAHVVHEWGDAELNTLLDYVYFETEPMQGAHRGERLDFSVVKPLNDQRRVKIALDSKKLSELRKALTVRAADYEQLRTASEVSENLFDNLKEWDIDHALKLGKGDCKIDPNSLV
jgi:uncharacterized phage-associated protein